MEEAPAETEAPAAEKVAEKKDEPMEEINTPAAAVVEDEEESDDEEESGLHHFRGVFYHSMISCPDLSLRTSMLMFHPNELLFSSFNFPDDDDEGDDDEDDDG